MTSEQVSLANASLLKVGAKRISSFDDNQTEAIVVSEFYERSYRSLLQMYPWSFAMRTVDLALIPGKPDHEYEYRYALPQNGIVLQRVFPNQASFKIVGKELHCNDGNGIGIKYVHRVDEELISPMFEQTMMYYLASQITIPLTENVVKSDSNYAMFVDHLARAKSLDAQQHPQDGFQDFPLLNVRF